MTARSRRWVLVLASFLLLAPLAACGGGGGSTVTPPPPPPDLSTSLAAKASFTDADMRHLLTRTHFGVKASELAAVGAVGVPAYVDAMVVLPAPGTSAVDTQADAFLLNPTTDPPGHAGEFPSPTQVARWWEYVMQRTTTPFQEELAFFWHDHFAASDSVLESDEMWWVKTHENLWRGSGAGNLRTLLLAMARDWLMLEWLDGIRNLLGQPNENFGREFWELFTLGVDNGYTQDDIVQAARAWTGYRRTFVQVQAVPQTFQSHVIFDTAFHDPGVKTPLGVTIPAQNTADDYQAMVNLTLDNRPVAEWISRKILEHFCYDDPPQVVIDGLAQVMRNANYELAPVFAALFKSEAFYSSLAKSGFVKGPVEECVGFIRSTGLLIDPNGRGLDESLTALGQRPTQPPTVNGWPVGDMWLSAQGMVDRANLVEKCIAARTYQAAQVPAIDVAALIPPGTPTSGQVVDALAALLRITLTQAEHDRYVTYLDTDLVGGVVVPDPFDPASAADRDERVRGLLYVLVQHPTYLVR